jgi:hypothetical protein
MSQTSTFTEKEKALASKAKEFQSGEIKLS